MPPTFHKPIFMSTIDPFIHTAYTTLGASPPVALTTAADPSTTSLDSITPPTTYSALLFFLPFA